MSIIEDIVSKRRAFATNVFLLETLDPLRFEQLIEARFPIKKDWDFEQRLVWNLQTNTVMRHLPADGGYENVPVEMNTEDVLEEQLKTKATLLILKWVISKTPVDSLANRLLEWAQNKEIKVKLSTVIVLASAISLFPSELLRWGHIIRVPPSTEEEREELLKKLADELSASKKITVDNSIITVDNSIITSTRGLNLHELRNAAFESFAKYKQFRLNIFSQYKIQTILASYKIRYLEPKFGFEGVKGYDYLKSYFSSRVIKPLTESEKYLSEGITPPKGMVLYGPPGVGKTYFAHSLAKESGLSVIQISPSDFLSSLVGETEARVRQITELIESLAPVVCFIDEADQLLTSRSRLNEATDSGVSSRMISGLLEWLGSPDRAAFVIAATNYIERIDKAFLRIGRLDKSVLVLYPDFQARLEMLKFYSASKRVSSSVNFEELAKETVYWNSAEISQLPIEAAYLRFAQGAPEITQEHFETAMKENFHIDVSQRKKDTEQLIRTYSEYVPNYEPALLKRAQEAMKQEEQDVTKLFTNINP